MDRDYIIIQAQNDTIASVSGEDSCGIGGPCRVGYGNTIQLPNGTLISVYSRDSSVVLTKKTARGNPQTQILVSVVRWELPPSAGPAAMDTSEAEGTASGAGAGAGAGASHPCVRDGVVARASCFGFDEHDATAALQTALSWPNVSKVTVDKMPSPWIVTPLFITNDDLHVHFADDVLVLAKKGNFTGSGDGLLTVARRRNVTLSGGRNATLKMRRADYADPSKYSKSEFRMGLWLVDSVDVTIRGLSIVDTGGDGIFVGGGVPCRFPGDHRCLAGSVGCRRVHIHDCNLVNAYRNGMSVISAEDMLVERTT